MAVVYIQSYHGDTHLLAGDSLLNGLGHPLGEKHQRGKLLIAQVENIVGLLARNYQHMARMHRVDVEEGEMILILGHFIRGNLPRGDT